MCSYASAVWKAGQYCGRLCPQPDGTGSRTTLGSSPAGRGQGPTDGRDGCLPGPWPDSSRAATSQRPADPIGTMRPTLRPAGWAYSRWPLYAWRPRWLCTAGVAPGGWTQSRHTTAAGEFPAHQLSDHFGEDPAVFTTFPPGNPSPTCALAQAGGTNARRPQGPYSDGALSGKPTGVACRSAVARADRVSGISSRSRCKVVEYRT